MRRIFWLTMCLAAYFWFLTSGKEQFLLDRGKALIHSFTAWLDDADADFHMQHSKQKKKSRRWD